MVSGHAGINKSLSLIYDQNTMLNDSNGSIIKGTNNGFNERSFAQVVRRETVKNSTNISGMLEDRQALIRSSTQDHQLSPNKAL